MSEQRFVFGIVTVPYGDVPPEHREEIVDDVLVSGLQASVARMDDAGVRGVAFVILDEHGVAEWMAEMIEEGLAT